MAATVRWAWPINCGWQMQNTNRLRAVFVFVSCGCGGRRQAQTLKMKVATSGQDGGHAKPSRVEARHKLALRAAARCCVLN